VAAWRSGGLPILATSHITYCLVALSNEEHPPLRQTARCALWSPFASPFLSTVSFHIPLYLLCQFN